MNDFKSTHNLEFEVAEWEYSNEFKRFRIGTVTGLWLSRYSYYGILALVNHAPQNGHLQDVFDWFENSCKRDKKDFKVLEIMNPAFKIHLMEKRGFRRDGRDNVIKVWRKIK